MRCRELCRWAVMVGVVGTAVGAAGEEPAVVRVAGGGVCPGRLMASDDPGVLVWQGEAFAGPFRFAAGRVESVDWRPVQPPPRPSGAFRIELDGGDTLFGELVHLDGEAAEVDLGLQGRLRLRRDAIRRMDRWGDGSALVYLGPTGLSGWKSEPEGGWRDESGRPASDQPGSVLSGAVGMPARAVIDVELSWERRGDFVLVLGSGSDDRATRRAFRLEVWNETLVVVRETETEADLAALGGLASGAGRLTLRMYLDQEAGRLIVVAPDGALRADLTVEARHPVVGEGVIVENVGGDLRLDRLQVMRWDGLLPEAVADRGRVVLKDSAAVAGQVERMEGGSLVVRDGEGRERRLAIGEVAGFTLEGRAELSGAEVRLVYQDGSRLSGALRRIGTETVTLERPGVQGLVELPRAGLRSLVWLRGSGGSEEVTGQARLELDDGTRLHGRLVDGEGGPGQSCLRWHPTGSSLAAALKPGVAGRIVYREPPPVVDPPTQPRVAIRRVRPGAGPLMVLDRFRMALEASRDAPRHPRGPALYLRSGDTIPCQVTRIDEEGVYFNSPMTTSTFVPHAEIKAMELAPLQLRVLVGKVKRERLLTLPRMQKDSPPTHLIRSRSGDYIRGRLVGMDGETLRVELRLEERQIDRREVAYVIWFHPDELEGAQAAPAGGNQAPAERGETRLQAVRSDGTRLTFRAERLTEGVLKGRSDVLGPCEVVLSEVDRLILGASVEREAAELAAQRWKLKPAAEPRIADAETGEGPSGLESSLVGRPAPDFELELLNGGRFHLAKEKGKVVILDFWATWCGPCLQTMPQVERVAAEFKDQGVRLVAVNLQESPDEIRGMLERHQLGPEVALDRDGVVAHRYGANAIPQTVVIGRDGVIERLYVGAAPGFEQALREALRQVVSGDGAKEEEPGAADSRRDQ